MSPPATRQENVSQKSDRSVVLRSSRKTQINLLQAKPLMDPPKLGSGSRAVGGSAQENGRICREGIEQHMLAVHAGERQRLPRASSPHREAGAGCPGLLLC
jgi:hypothetical protein